MSKPQGNEVCNQNEVLDPGGLLLCSVVLQVVSRAWTKEKGVVVGAIQTVAWHRELRWWQRKHLWEGWSSSSNEKLVADRRIDQISKYIRDNGSYIHQSYKTGKQIWKAESYKQFCSIGLEWEVLVWTHGVQYTY